MGVKSLRIALQKPSKSLFLKAEAAPSSTVHLQQIQLVQTFWFNEKATPGRLMSILPRYGCSQTDGLISAV